MQEQRHQLRDAEMQRANQSRALEEMREQLEASERGQYFHRSDREDGSSRRSPSPPPRLISRLHDDLLVSDLRQKLVEYEIVNSRLQQNCSELRTNLGEEITNLEEVKRWDSYCKISVNIMYTFILPMLEVGIRSSMWPCV